MGVPDYIKEEIDKYIFEKEHKIKRFTTYDNIVAYIGLAKMSGRITDEEADELLEFVKDL